MEKHLNPEEIYRQLIDGKLDKNTANQLLVSFIENSGNDDDRLNLLKFWEELRRTFILKICETFQEQRK